MARNKKVLSNHQKKMSKYYSQEVSLDYSFDEISLGTEEEHNKPVITKSSKLVGYCNNEECLSGLCELDKTEKEGIKYYRCYKCRKLNNYDGLLTFEERTEKKRKLLEELQDLKIIEPIEEEEEDIEESLSLKKNSEVENKNSEVENEDDFEEDEYLDEDDKINYYIDNFLTEEE